MTALEGTKFQDWIKILHFQIRHFGEGAVGGEAWFLTASLKSKTADLQMLLLHFSNKSIEAVHQD